MKVTGRSYATRNEWRCSECKRNVNQLVAARVSPAYLRICGKLECHELLCWPCRITHEAMHELAGEQVNDPWLRAERKRNVFNRV